MSHPSHRTDRIDFSDFTPPAPSGGGGLDLSDFQPPLPAGRPTPAAPSAAPPVAGRRPEPVITLGPLESAGGRTDISPELLEEPKGFFETLLDRIHRGRMQQRAAAVQGKPGRGPGEVGDLLGLGAMVASSPIWQRHEEPEARRIVGQNLMRGVREGSFLVPDGSKPMDEDELLQMVASMPVMVAEGLGAERMLVKSLMLLKNGAAGKQVAATASKILNKTGHDPATTASLTRRVVGGAALTAAAEVPLQTASVAYGDQTVKQAATNVALVGAPAPLAAAAKAVKKPVTAALEWSTQKLRQTSLADAFVYENKLRAFEYPDADSRVREGMRGGMADRLREYAIQSEIATSRAKEEIGRVLQPLERSKTPEADTQRFVQLVRAEGNHRKALEYGFGVEGKTAEEWNDIRKQLQRSAPVEIANAFLDYRRWMDDLFAEVKASGKIQTPQEFELFVNRFSAQQGSINSRNFETFVGELTGAASKVRGFQAYDDLVRETVQFHGIPLTHFDPATAARIAAGETVAAIDGTPVKLFRPEDASPFSWKNIQNAGDTTTGYALPAPLADRLASLSEKPLSQTRLRRLLGGVNAGTNAWKGSTLFWGMSQFLMKQILSDPVSMLRSSPGDAAYVGKALKAVFNEYRAPMMGSTQLLSSSAGFAGGAAGSAAVDLAQGQPVSVEDALGFGALGAAAGYGVGTYKAAGTARYDGYLGNLYAMARKDGVVGSTFVQQELGMATASAGVGSKVADTGLTLLGGSVRGNPMEYVGKTVQKIAQLQNDRESILRLASYFHRLEDGVDHRVAAKQAREIYVDYGRFTDFENKYLRGFLLPFYSFAKSNTANWVMTAAGKDVGGKPAQALAATAGLATLDVASQAWNETFFPQVEKKLRPEQRDKFHVIVGNPYTGEPVLNKQGEPVVAGLEMPYEQFAELAGVARPGAIWSEFFGMGMHPNDSLYSRAQRIEDYARLDAHGKRVLDGWARSFKNLLTPLGQIPAEIATGVDLRWGSPIIDEKYAGNEVAGWLDYLGRKTLRAYSETKKLSKQLTEGSFEVTKSPFGLGLPLYNTRPERGMQRRVSDLLEYEEKESGWQAELKDLIFRRENIEEPAPDEQKLLDELLSKADNPREREERLRYYAKAASHANLQRQWDSMSIQERAKAAKRMSEADQMAMVFLINGGQLG